MTTTISRRAGRLPASSFQEFPEPCPQARQEDHVAATNPPDRPSPPATPSTPAPASSTEQPWTIQRILSWTTEHLRKHGSEAPRLEGEILLAHARRCARIELYAHFHDVVDEQTRSLMRDLVKRRMKQEPVAYLVGHREFYSLDFHVEPGVFIPRPETETLVSQTLERIAAHPAPRVLDLCTGSGCVAVTIAVRNPRVRVVAIEKNPLPLRVARQNAERHQVSERVEVLEGDLFAPLPTETEPFDVIVTNPPYVTSAEIAGLPPEVQGHEPHAALDGGDDGLDCIRRILQEGPAYLKAGGWLLIEMDPAQIPQVLQLAEHSPDWTQQQAHADPFGQTRFLSLVRPSN